MAETERIHSIDVIRGIAIFGIFLVNWPSITGMEVSTRYSSYVDADAFIRFVYDLFIQTKFYTIFSFLFGLGFFIFLSRAEEKTKQPILLFVRRLLLLFAFGTLHYVMLWQGDILHSYAAAGFALLLFYRRRALTVLVWSLSLLVLFQLLILLSYGGAGSAATGAPNEMMGLNPFYDWQTQASSRFQKFTGMNILFNLIYLPETVGLFLLGLYAGKIQLFRQAAQWDRQLKILQIAVGLLTIPSWYAIIRYYAFTDIYSSHHVFPYVLLSGKTLFVFYIITIVRAMNDPKWQRLFRPFQYVGRMALTNYLSQTILTALLFLFVPNGTYIPLEIGILYCISFYTAQVAWSKWWLSRFQYGPMEYIWRLGTYGRMLKKERAN